MEKTVKYTSVMGKTVNGCVMYNRDIMLSIDYDDNDFSNFYFTTKQTQELIEQLQRRLKQNEEID